MVYNATDSNSLHGIKQWHQIVTNHYCSDGHIPIILFGNKCDETEKKQVTFESALQVAENLGIKHCVEVSAKEGTNVEIAFTTLAADYIQTKIL